MKEIFKSIALISLTCLLVVLVGVLWFEPAQGDSALQEQKKVYTVSDVSYLIDVESVNIMTENDQIKTFFYDVGNIFQKLKPIIANNLMYINDSVEISAAEYYAARGRYSVEFQMRSELSSRALLTIISNSDILFKPKVDHVAKILVTAESAIYLSDGTVYYKLTAEPLGIDIDGYIASLALKNEVVYKTIDQQLSVEQNDENKALTLLPTALEEDFKPVKVYLETTPQNEEDVLLIASSVFGSQLSFVRRFYDVNGSLVMMYGYGEKALKISNNGTLTVNQKINNQISREANLLKDIKLALDVLADYNKDTGQIYLKSATPFKEDELTGYDFNFGYKINRYDVYNKVGVAGINIKVIGGQLQYYKRDYKRFLEVVSTPEVAQTLPILAIMNMQTNYDKIVQNYMINNPNFSDDDTTIAQILAKISNFKLLYVDKGSLFVPAYRFDIEDDRYYFNAYDFSLIEEEVK